MIKQEKMTLKALIDDLERETGADRELLEYILISHSVPQSYASYRLFEIMRKCTKESVSELSLKTMELKKERTKLDDRVNKEEANKVSKELNRTRGKAVALQAINKILKEFGKYTISKLDNNIENIRELDNNEYSDIGKEFIGKFDKHRKNNWEK